MTSGEYTDTIYLIGYIIEWEVVITAKNNFFKLELLILKSLKHKDFYGYEMSLLIKEKTQGMFDIKEGVMYPILYNLLNNEFISSYESSVNRRIRVYYHIQDKGLDYLRQLETDFDNGVSLVQNFLLEV